MAEAADAGGTDSGAGPQNAENARFYCHKCSLQILPLPDLLCPVCRGGFIEEMSDVAAERRDDFVDVWANVVDRFNSRYSPQYLFNQFRVAGFLDGPHTVGLTNLHGGGFIMPLHGSPGDYAWGSGGLDAVITHLLNQLDGAGPAPLTQQQIDAIPEAKISAEQVKCNLQCSVCMEDFTLDEVARKLECGHHFHASCITPWLQIHATCPICRLQLTSAAGGSAAGRGTDGASTGTGDSSGTTHPSNYAWEGGAAAASSSTTTTPASRVPLGSRTTPGTPSTSGAVQRRPATYQEDDCD